jgi:hypothetical protein
MKIFLSLGIDWNKTSLQMMIGSFLRTIYSPFAFTKKLQDPACSPSMGNLRTCADAAAKST